MSFLGTLEIPTFPQKISMSKYIPIIRKFRIFIGNHVRGSKIGDPKQAVFPNCLIESFNHLASAITSQSLPNLVNRCSLWVAPGASFSPPFGMRNCPNLCPSKKRRKRKNSAGLKLDFKGDEDRNPKPLF